MIDSESKNSQNFLWATYLLLFFAVLNPILRISIHNPITPFRMLAPLFVLIIFYRNSHRNILLFTFAFVVYDYICSSLFAGEIIFFNSYILHWLYVLCLLTIMIFIHRYSASLYVYNRKFDIRLFIKVCVYFLYFLYFGNKLFNIYLIYNTNYDGYINTIYTSPNDLGLCFGIFIIYMFTDPKTHIVEKIAHSVIIFYINYVNDAKAILISQAFCLFLFLIYKTFVFLRQKKLLFIKLFLVALFVFIPFSILRTNIPFSYSSLSLKSLIMDPLLRIIKQDPYRLEGSIYDRTDVAIFSLSELKKTYGLGLGSGNSQTILTWPIYKTSSAQSLHNFFLEVFVEFGWFFIFAISILLIKLTRETILSKPNSYQWGKWLLLLNIPLLSVSQSSGYISNYLFIIILFEIFLRKSETEKNDLQQIKFKF